MRPLFILFAVMIVGSCCDAATECLAVSAAKEAEVTKYVRQQYHIEADTNLTVKAKQAVEGSCYQQLTIEGKAVLKTWELTLYLSPDQRFVMPQVFDMSKDPVEAEKEKADAVMASLAENKGVSMGPSDAPVTIVEFSDFECPYCRNFSEILAQVLPKEKNKVRLVFHHMPLSNHPWARVASEGAACAQFQSADAFWMIHDRLFAHQQELTVNNIKSSLISYGKDSTLIDVEKFQACLDNQMSLGLVFRDMDLASVNHVDATPTVFVNGHAMKGVRNADELRGVIDEAAKEAADTARK
jgi:protein-disulfide isomerase